MTVAIFGIVGLEDKGPALFGVSSDVLGASFCVFVLGGLFRFKSSQEVERTQRV
jgi:hypothetical protein